MAYAEIVLPIKLNRKFDYRIPETLTDKIVPGRVVVVPFGRRDETGYCVGITSQTSVPSAKLKEIKLVREDIDPLDKNIMELTRWVADYYFCSWGEALEATLPEGVREKPKQRRKILPDEEAAVNKQPPFPPTIYQARAIDRISDCIRRNKHLTFLLHGITGSGKTEIYLQVIADVIKQQKQAIVLVPEISLTPQTVNRFRARFDRVVALHSYLTPRQRAMAWHKIRSGEVDIVIGTRSAVFAPTKNLGIMVIDEEHETSFKQENTPRYHARDVAIKRAEIENAVVVLGSATPSLESYYLAQQGRYHYIELPERIEKRPLPKVEIIDLSGEPPDTIISQRLGAALTQAIRDKEQVILFLNRRGFVTLLNCPHCRYIFRCRHCQIALTYHKKTDKLICHHCGEESSLPLACPECGHKKFKKLGMGTERVEEYARSLFSKEGIDFRVDRVDRDVMRRRRSGNEALTVLGNGNSDILVGTQLVAKGLDFPKVTLVGIISADTALYLKDFRSAEWTFQLITQVAGRTGRGHLGGRVLLQTVHPEHYSIIHGARHDYHTFARQEMEFRKAFNYPPFCHLLRILVEGKNEGRVKEYCARLIDRIRQVPLEILGPAPCPWAKIRDRFRWQIVIKSERPETFREIYRRCKQQFTATGGLKLVLDVDPTNLL